MMTVHDNTRPGGRALLTRCLVLLALLCCPVAAGEASAQERPRLSGTIRNADGTPARDAEVFVYRDQNVRTTAAFISPRTGGDGRFSLELPAGAYWVVARTRSDAGRYGPLMAGDKHSGDPAAVELVPGGTRELELTVRDIREAARTIARQRADYVRVEGTIVDGQGRPVNMAYAAACVAKPPSGLPDFVSAWTDADGRYTLFLPAGRYYVGGARDFPPDTLAGVREVLLDADRSGLEIVLKPPVRE